MAVEWKISGLRCPRYIARVGPLNAIVALTVDFYSGKEYAWKVAVCGAELIELKDGDFPKLWPLRKIEEAKKAALQFANELRVKS